MRRLGGMKSWLARISRWRSGVSLLEEADVWRLYIVCKHRREAQASGAPPSREWMREVVDRPPPFAEQKALVHAELQVQALRLLRSEHDAASPTPARESSGLPFSVVLANKTGLERRPQGGVRLVGRAQPGDLVCFFPGVVFKQRDLWHLPGGTEALADANAFATHDGSVVSASHLHLLPPKAVANSFGLGHEINHPPAKTQPNVMPFKLEIEVATLREELRAVLPNMPFSAVASTDEAESQRSLNDMFRSSLMGGDFAGAEDDNDATRSTLAMVALREIVDEELFLNYRLNPRSGAPRPHWYEPVSALEEELRWRG